MFTSVEQVWRDFVQVQNATLDERVDRNIYNQENMQKSSSEMIFRSETAYSKNTRQAMKWIQVISYEYLMYFAISRDPGKSLREWNHTHTKPRTVNI